MQKNSDISGLKLQPKATQTDIANNNHEASKCGTKDYECFKRKTPTFDKALPPYKDNKKGS